jgi:transmembrane sensor
VGVEYDGQQRLLTLERGEALFQVARDPKRPFIVRAGRGFVRAIGTRFDVLIDSKRDVTVAVLEGRVDVVPQPQTALAHTDSHMLLDAGQAVAFETAGKLVQANTEHASSERINAWREGRLRFDAWPLGDAIREHNRYAAKPIRLGSPELEGLKVSGVFRVGDTEALLTALRRLLDVRAAEQQDSIVLTAKAATD